MADLLEKIKTNQKETKEAMEHKAAEYEELTRQIKELTETVSKLKGLYTVTGRLENDLKDIKENIKAINNKGEEAIAPLKANITTLKEQVTSITSDLQKAGEAAEKKIKNGKPYYRNIWEVLIEGAIRIGYVFAFTFLALWVFGIMDMKNDVAYNRDRIDAIHYNQAYGSHYSPFDMQQFYKAWDNQQEYLKNERQQATAAQDKK